MCSLTPIFTRLVGTFSSTVRVRISVKKTFKIRFVLASRYKANATTYCNFPQAVFFVKISILAHLPMDITAVILEDDKFKCIFCNEKKCSYECSLQQAGIGPGNGLATKTRQAIAWTNVDPVHWRICATLGGGVLKESGPLLNNINNYN